MKRDMELVRQILLAIEESNSPCGKISLEIPDHEREVVAYHVKLLWQAGLVVVSDEYGEYSDNAGYHCNPSSLTWEGHEFLDAARNDTVWNKAMTKLKGQATTVPFEVLKVVVIQTCKEMFGVN